MEVKQSLEKQTDAIDTDIFLQCPSCGDIFMTTEKTINCSIYRHAIFKNNMQQLNPHASKEECDRVIKENLVFGCAKPFKVIKNNENKYETVVCDYI